MPAARDRVRDVVTLAPAEFKAATWNVFHGTHVDKLRPVLDGLLRTGVSVFSLQEAAGRDIESMLAARGLGTFASGSELVAWAPGLWTAVHTDNVRLARSVYYREGSKVPVVTDMATAILCDAWGRSMLAGSYHTPPSVQGGPTKAPVRRWATLRESVETWDAVTEDALTRAVMLAGDDNVDERAISGSAWRFMLATRSYRLVQAPAATHAGGRRIDDFRVKGLTPRTGSVRPGGGDHKVHVRTFRWT